MRSTILQFRTMAILSVVLLTGAALAGCVEQDAGDGMNDGGSSAMGVKTTCGGKALALPAAAGNATMDSGAFAAAMLSPAEMVRLNAAAVQGSLGTLKLGSLMPLTGSLAAYGGDMQKAVELAVSDLNAAAAGLATVELHPEDSKSDKAEAPTAMNKLVSEGVTAVVGAASSGVTASILDIAVQNKVVVVSPASTSPSLTQDRENEGYFWRVPPSDALQGKILANLVWSDGCTSASVAALNNPYGQDLAKQFRTTFAALGGSLKGETVLFSEQTTSFPSELETLAQAAGAATVFIGYPVEGAPFMKQAFEKGIMADSVFFFSEGVKADAFVTDTGKTTGGAFIVAGLGGTTPADLAGPRSAAFIEKFTSTYEHAPNLFAAESYDAAIALALASVAAGSTEGAAIKEKMRFVMNAPGAKVSNLQEALGLLAAGQDIDWQGVTGDFGWDEKGDPEGGTYSYWVVKADGTIATKAIPE